MTWVCTAVLVCRQPTLCDRSGGRLLLKGGHRRLLGPFFPRNVQGQIKIGKSTGSTVPLCPPPTLHHLRYLAISLYVCVHFVIIMFAGAIICGIRVEFVGFDVCRLPGRSRSRTAGWLCPAVPGRGADSRHPNHLTVKCDRPGGLPASRHPIVFTLRAGGKHHRANTSRKL